MLSLKPFKQADFHRLKSWIKTEKELIQFAGPIFTFPLTDEQLIKYIALTDRKICSIVLDETNEVIGHCEFNFENEIPRISRILIGSPKDRNKGYGSALIQLMVKRFFEDPKVNQIDLNVFEWNQAAIKCYTNLGFTIRNTSIYPNPIENEFWGNHNMLLNREDFEKLIAANQH